MNKATIPYILAGYPDLGTTEKLLKLCAKSGIKYIELGIPFTDPSADGPVIQNAAESASKTFVMENLLNLLSRLANENLGFEITIMTYLNPIFAFGLADFLKRIDKISIIKGLLIPDLPFEEKDFIAKAFKGIKNIKPVWLVSENLEEQSLESIVKSANYYLYLVAYLGTTGKDIDNYDHIKQTIKRIKEIKDLPVAVGFGIKSKDDIKNILKIANGAVIGTHLIKLLNRGYNKIEDFLKTIVQ